MSFLLRLYEKTPFECVSFDVFDTLLLRSPHSELSRFYGAAKHHRKALLPIGDFDVSDLFNLRSYCHFLGYRTTPLVNGQREAGVSHIFHMMCTGLNIGDKWVEPLIQAEVEYECSLLRANMKLIRDACAIRKRGAKIYVVSDMYLRRMDIAALLAKLCPQFIYDDIFVSSEYGQSKHKDGSLFRLFLEQTKLSPGRVLHVGDNLHSDVDQARGMGMEAIHLPRGKIFHLLWKLYNIGKILQFGRKSIGTV